jgi:hypothetical protein
MINFSNSQSPATNMIVSGDADLLVLSPFRGIPIVAPPTFVQGTARMPAGKE